MTDAPTGNPGGSGNPGNSGGTDVEPVRLYGPEFHKDTAAVYAEIRRLHGPVAPILLEGDVFAWFVCGYREVHQVCSDPETFGRDSRRWNGWDQVAPDWPLLFSIAYNPSVMFAEGEEHQKRAGAVSDALGGIDQFEVASKTERLADELIDVFAARGEADLVAEYAMGLPLSVLSHMAGIPESEVDDLVSDLTHAAELGPDVADIYVRVLNAMQRLVENKRENPGADMTSTLLAHPANLSGDEIQMDMLVMLIAAQLPTANWIGNTLRLMLTDERFATSLAGGRASVGQALNEVLWYDTPNQNFLGRWTTRDTLLAGQRIQKGDMIVLGLAAANADPRVREHGAAQGNHAQMSFGHGEHSCPFPAPEVAEVIARTAVEVLLDRLPDLELAVSTGELRWRQSVWARGLDALPVKFTPAYVSSTPR